MLKILLKTGVEYNDRGVAILALEDCIKHGAGVLVDKIDEYQKRKLDDV
ncbi:MAG: hypothetical protein V7K27_04940 [Nostoc sp.]